MIAGNERQLVIGAQRIERGSDATHGPLAHLRAVNDVAQKHDFACSRTCGDHREGRDDVRGAPERQCRTDHILIRQVCVRNENAARLRQPRETRRERNHAVC